MSWMFVFPGQGSQSPGMGKFLFDEFKIAKQTFEEASDALKLDFKKLCFESSEADLALTENTQPVLLLVSTVTSRVLSEVLGFHPIHKKNTLNQINNNSVNNNNNSPSREKNSIGSVAGHSIGEYGALVTANVIDFAQAIKAVRIRGQSMQSAVPVGEGAMAAVMGLDPAQTVLLCQYIEKESGFSPVSAANFNCPGQIVISGSAKAIQWAKDQLKPEAVFGESVKRLKLIPLQVSAPFHCQMMKPAEDRMRSVLSEIKFNSPDCSVIQNFTAQEHNNPAEIRENLIRQVSAPVQWMQSMELAKSKGFNKVIECGAGKVVNGLLKKIDGEFFQVFNVNSIDDIKLIESDLKN